MVKATWSDRLSPGLWSATQLRESDQVNRFVRIAAVVGGLSLLTACAATQAQRDGMGERDSAGPIEIDLPHTWFYEARQAAVFSDGLEILRVQGTVNAEIESVQVDGGDKALRFLGARIGLPGRPDDFNLRMDGFPPKAVPARFQAPAEGATLEPGKAYMLILGYQVRDERVMDRRSHIIVNYTVGNRRYEAVIPAGLVTCPPPLTDMKCEFKSRD